METLFWVSVLLVAYVYAGYPMLLGLWAWIVNRPVRKRLPGPGEPWPAVSVVLAAHDEAQQLRGRIANLLEQTYPGRLEVIVVSDGSEDDTSDVLAWFGNRIRAVELPRGGKPTALNAGVSAATGEIVVFADARQRFAEDAIYELVANFADGDVGGVSGELILDCEYDEAPSDSTIGGGVGLYWKYEKWLRRHESRVWSTLGATGAIYALRRSLWRRCRRRRCSTTCLARCVPCWPGKRIVFDDKARAFDRVAESGSAESRRKVRTLAGNYQIVRARAAAAPAVRQSGLDSVPLAQARTFVGALGSPRCVRYLSRSGGPVLDLRGGIVSAALLLRPGRFRRMGRVQKVCRSRTHG